MRKKFSKLIRLLALQVLGGLGGGMGVPEIGGSRRKRFRASEAAPRTRTRRSLARATIRWVSRPIGGRWLVVTPPAHRTFTSYSRCSANIAMLVTIIDYPSPIGYPAISIVSGDETGLGVVTNNTLGNTPDRRHL